MLMMMMMMMVLVTHDREKFATQPGTRRAGLTRDG
jgi:hypothetical protein